MPTGQVGGGGGVGDPTGGGAGGVTGGGGSPPVGTFQGGVGPGQGGHVGQFSGDAGARQFSSSDPTSGATSSVGGQVRQPDLRAQADLATPSVPSTPSPEAELRNKTSGLRDPQSAVSVDDPTAGARADVRAKADVRNQVSVDDPRDQVSGVQGQASTTAGRANEVRATVNDPTGAAEVSVTGAARGAATEHGVTKAESDVRQAHGVATDPTTAATDEARSRAAAKERELRPDVSVTADVKVDPDPTKK